jgi:hypothetical protein
VHEHHEEAREGAQHMLGADPKLGRGALCAAARAVTARRTRFVRSPLASLNLSRIPRPTPR